MLGDLKQIDPHLDLSSAAAQVLQACVRLASTLHIAAIASQLWPPEAENMAQAMADRVACHRRSTRDLEQLLGGSQ
jgi:hypothetical protein